MWSIYKILFILIQTASYTCLYRKFDVFVYTLYALLAAFVYEYRECEQPYNSAWTHATSTNASIYTTRHYYEDIKILNCVCCAACSALYM